jgi:hypothetical protein
MMMTDRSSLYHSHLTPAGLASFFILYILFEIPSQFFLKRLGARWWISGMVITCGIGESASFCDVMRLKSFPVI